MFHFPVFNRPRIFAVGLLVGLLGLVIVMGWYGSIVAAEKVGTAVGDKAPDFALTDLNGTRVALNDVVKQNKVTLINFWGIWCPYCVREIPELVSFYQENHKRGVEILGIDVGDNPGALPGFVRQKQINYPVLVDKAQSVSRLYQVSGFPTTLFVNRQGKIVDQIIGATDRETLNGRLKAILVEP